MRIDHPDDVAEVRAAFEAYEAALIRNEVPKLEAFFWDSPNAVRFGAGEQLYGREAINRFRRKRRLNFRIRKPVQLSISTFDGVYASVMYEYISDIDGIEQLGRQSQAWVRVEDAWKIVSAHISYLPGKDSVQLDLEKLGLQTEPEWRSRIGSNFDAMSRLADTLMAFPISENIESESIFRP